MSDYVPDMNTCTKRWVEFAASDNDRVHSRLRKNKILLCLLAADAGCRYPIATGRQWDNFSFGFSKLEGSPLHALDTSDRLPRLAYGMSSGAGRSTRPPRIGQLTVKAEVTHRYTNRGDLIGDGEGICGLGTKESSWTTCPRDKNSC